MFTLAGRTRLAVIALDVAILAGGVVGLSTIGPSSRDVIAADAERAARRGMVSGTSGWSGSTDSNGPVQTGPDQPVMVSPSPQPGTGTGPRVRRGGTSTTVQPAPAQPVGPSSAGGIASTRPGVYESRVTEDGEDGEDDSVETEVVDVVTLRRSTTEVVQVHRRRPSDGEDYDEDEDQEFRWTADALLIVVPADQSDDCSAKELRWLKLPLAEGSTWGDRMECRSDDGDSDMGMAIEINSRVLGSRTVQAAGRSWFVWEVVTEMDSKPTGQPDPDSDFTDFSFHVTRRVLFSPELGYEVRAEETESTDAPDDEGFSSKKTTELLKAPE